MRFITLSLLLLLGVSGLYAQEAVLKGRVYDVKDEEALPSVRVIIDDTSGTLTNLNGEFTFKTDSGSHSIKVKYESYQTFKTTVNVIPGEKNYIEVPLSSDDTRLKTVVISASQYKKNLQEETVSIDLIDKRLIENNNATELGEAVDKSVGTQVIDGQILIRGGSSWSYGIGSRTAVMVDNVSFMSGDLGEAQFKQAPLENTEQIEVIKGASSVIYGSSALNGVVNVITAWPGKKPYTKVTAFGGIYDNPPRREMKWWSTTRNFSGLSFSHRQQFGDFDLIAGGNVNLVTNYLNQTDETRLRTNFKFRHRNPNKTGMSYGVNGNVMWENSGRFFLLTDLDSGAYIPDDPNIDRYVRTNIDPHFTYVTPRGERHRVLARYMNVYRIGSSDSVEIDSVTGEPFSPDASSNLFSIDYQYLKRWKDGKYNLTAGLPLSFSTNKSNLYPGRRLTSSGAVYGQFEYKINRFSAVAGTRYEFNQVDSFFVFTRPVFRAGLNYQAAKFTWLRASWGQAYRLPSVGERFVTAEFSILNIFPNPELRPERGWGAEIGIKQGIGISKWMGLLDFNIFWNEYQDFVQYNLGIFPPAVLPPGTVPFDFLGLKPYNVEQARIMGYEVSLISQGMLGPIELRSLVGYTYHYPANLAADSTQRNIGTFLGNVFGNMGTRLEYPVDPADYLSGAADTASVLLFRNRHLFKGDIEAFYKQFSLGFTWLYTSFPEAIPSMFFIAVPGLQEYVDDHQKGDWIMGLRASYTYKDNLKFALIIKNLTNHEYAFRVGKFDPPRSFTLQIGYQF